MTDAFDGPELPDLDPADVEAATLNDDLKRLAVLKRERDDLKAQFEAADTAYHEHRDRCYERMEDEETESTRLAGQLFVRNKPTWFATVQDRRVFQAWAKQNAPSVLKQTEAEKELNKLVRACIDDGRPFPPGLSAYPRKVVAVRQ